MLVGAQMGPDCPCLSWEATNIGMASGTLEVYPISWVVAIGMSTYNSLGEGKHSRPVWLQGPEPVGCVGQGFGLLSKNTNSAYVSGHRYGRTDLQTMRRTLRDMKKGRV